MKRYREKGERVPRRPSSRPDSQREHKAGKERNPLVKAALAGIAIVAAGVLATTLFFSFREPRPSPEIPDEFAGARAQYNEAFRLIADGQYEGALPKIVAARETWQAICEQHPSVPWIEDYFTRLNRWERVLREWEFARENEAWSRKRLDTRPAEEAPAPMNDSVDQSPPIQ